MLQVHYESEFHGPSPYAAEAVVVARLTPLAGVSVDPGALLLAGKRMQAAFPQWLPQLDQEGEAIEVTARTLAQWALGLLNEVRGFLHEAGARTDDGCVRLWVAFHQAPITHKAIEAAVEVLSLAMTQAIDRTAARDRVDAVLKMCRNQHPDFQARILMEGARVAGIPVLPLLRGGRLWNFGWGVRSRFFLESSSNADGFLGTNLQRSKSQTKALFARLGMPTPRGALVSRPEELASAVRMIGWPCVLKPEDKGGGRGVTANIRTMPDLEAAYRHARTFSDTPLLLETFVPGFDHRIMVLDGKVHAVSRRQASWLTGDGKRSIAQLLAELNRNRSSNILKSNYMRPIATDDVLVRHLAGQGLTVESVLQPGQVATLRSNANLSTGGVCTDVTAQLHPSTRQFAEMFAITLGLGHTGLDYITEDIGKPWQEGGGFIEANPTPGLDAIIAAGHDPVKLALAVLGERPGRIPLRIAVVDDEALAGAVASLKAARVPPGSGWAARGHAQVGDTLLSISMPSARSALQALLLNQSVSDVLLVCGAGELAGDGLPVDRADAIALCTPKLGDAWVKVLRDSAGSVTQHAGWDAFANSGPLFSA